MTEHPIRPPGEIQESLRRLLPEQYVEKLMAARGSVTGERRVVTVLFSDVKGSTALAEHLDPEDVLEIMNGAFEVLIRPIAYYEGTLARLMGDAVMALFGAPIAHEDDPERACRAALDIIEGSHRYAERLEQERGVTGFNVRVGINTGLVVVAEVGADLRVEYTAMGDAVNLAARMESAAEPGAILITDATLKLVRNRFETAFVGDISVKGKSKPVRTYRLLRLKESTHDVVNTQQGTTRFIGRTSELTRLENALEGVQHGSGGVLAIVGESGIGKSRLVREARTRCFKNGIWAESRARGYTQGKSYEAAQMLMHSLLGLGGNVSASATLDELRSTIGRFCRDREKEILPYLSLLMEENPDQRVLPDLPSGNGEALQRRIHHAFGTLIRLHAATQPVVIVAEDMHWFDRSSLDLLESMFSMANELPVLFLLVYRPSSGIISDFHERHYGLPGRRSPIVNVPPLKKKESAFFLDTLAQDATFPPPFRHEILTKTQGNPFFIEEVVRQVQERGETSLTVPDTLRGVLMARMDSLPPREQQTLQTASVLGRSFHKRVLMETMGNILPPASLDLSLAELSRRRFIAPDARGSAATDTSTDDTFVFIHNLTHQVVHDSLLLSQQKALHRRAGEAIESIFVHNLGEHAVALAEHFEAAGDRAKSLRYLIVAGERARAVCAHAEAREYYMRAASHAEDTGAAREDFQRIHEGLADACLLSARYSTALEHYARALTYASGGLATAVLHRKRGTVYEKCGRYDDAVSALEEAMKSLKQEADLAESARVFNGLARVYCRRREYGAAIEVGTIALDLMKQLGDEWGFAQASGTLGMAHCSGGDPLKGIEFHQQAYAIWERCDEQYGMAATLNNLGWAFQRSGDLARAEEYYRKSIALSERAGLRHALASACDNLSQILVRQGKRREANSYLKRAVTILAEIASHEPEPTAELWQQSGTS